MQYAVWTVFEGRMQRYYVVNMTDKSIQSAWKRRLDADQVCARLNKIAKGA